MYLVAWVAAGIQVQIKNTAGEKRFFDFQMVWNLDAVSGNESVHASPEMDVNGAE